jgi:hypothetical protein
MILAKLQCESREYPKLQYIALGATSRHNMQGGVSPNNRPGQESNRSLAMPFLVTRKPAASVETRTRFLLAPRLTCLCL